MPATDRCGNGGRLQATHVWTLGWCRLNSLVPLKALTLLRDFTKWCLELQLRHIERLADAAG